VLKNNSETLKFENDPNYQYVLESVVRYFKEDLTSLAFSYNQLSDQGFQTILQPLLQNFTNLKKLEITNN
jgi:hypothetical protein